MVAQSTADSNIFNVVKYDEKYWDGYLAARPKYDHNNFYSKILLYHKAHSGLQHVAHDIGTGPGQVAQMLVQHFDQVVASDLNETHLKICEHRNSKKSKLTCILSSAEELADQVPAGSADAIFCGEALALMDIPKAMDSFAKMLNKYGTFAAWYYGRPFFVDGNKVQCQSLYDEIVNRQFAKIIKNPNSQNSASWKRTTDVMLSWFDSVEFPGSAWQHVERHKWNTNQKMHFYDEEACDFNFERSSRIGGGETVTETEDDSMWAEHWDADGIRRYVEVLLPSFQEEGTHDEKVEFLYSELEQAMGGKGVKRTIAWPVVLLLGSKR